MLIAMAGALWVALVASIAAVVTAIASPLSTWLVAKSQRQSDEESRVYQDKVAAYIAVASDGLPRKELGGRVRGATGEARH